MRFEVRQISENSPEYRMSSGTPKVLIDNALKVISYIEDNYPKADGVFNCEHNIYTINSIVVRNGKAYLCQGRHGWPYEWYFGKDGCAHLSVGSMQILPYLYKGYFGVPNYVIEPILKEWERLKKEIEESHNKRSAYYSNTFEP